MRSFPADLVRKQLFHLTRLLLFERNLDFILFMRSFPADLVRKQLFHLTRLLLFDMNLSLI